MNAHEGQPGHLSMTKLFINHYTSSWYIYQILFEAFPNGFDEQLYLFVIGQNFIFKTTLHHSNLLQYIICYNFTKWKKIPSCKILGVKQQSSNDIPLLIIYSNNQQNDDKNSTMQGGHNGYFRLTNINSWETILCWFFFF